MERSDDRKYVCFRRVETTGSPFPLLFTNWRVPYFAYLDPCSTRERNAALNATGHASSLMSYSRWQICVSVVILFLVFLEIFLYLKTEVYNSEVYRGIARFQRSFYGEPIKISFQYRNYWYARVESVARVLRKTLNGIALSSWRYSKGQFLRTKIRPESEY